MKKLKKAAKEDRDPRVSSISIEISREGLADRWIWIRFYRGREKAGISQGFVDICICVVGTHMCEWFVFVCTHLPM